jgi:hypothetical protein
LLFRRGIRQEAVPNIMQHLGASRIGNGANRFPKDIFLSRDNLPQATLLPSRRSAACIIAMSVEPRKIGEAARYLSLPSIAQN